MSVFTSDVLAQDATNQGTQSMAFDPLIYEKLSSLDILPDVHTRILNNGLRVVVLVDNRAPVVTHMIWYQVGAADESPRETGLAHFFEHLMFKGTPHFPAGKFNDELTQSGGNQNAFTSRDYTAYYQRAHKDLLPRLMAYEADRMMNLTLNDDVVRTERDVVLEERRLRVDRDPAARLGEAFDAALYLNHPYGRPVIGWQHEIEALNTQQALDFYKRFYAPDVANVVVVGDVQPDDVFEMAEKTYGQIARPDRPTPQRVRPKEPEPIAARRILMRDAQVTQPMLWRQYLVPSYLTAKGNDDDALDLFVEIFGVGQNSVLYRTLVVEQKLAASVSVVYRGFAVDHTQLVISLVPNIGVSPETLESALDAELSRFLAQDKLDEASLQRGKLALMSETIYAQDSPMTLARAFGAGLTIGFELEELLNPLEGMKRVHGSDVLRVAQQYLQPHRSVTAWLLGDTPAPPPSVKQE